MKLHKHVYSEAELIERRTLVHDLRNALSPILMYAQLLEASLSKLKLQNEVEIAHMISDAVEEIDIMISARLDSSEAIDEPA